MRPEGVKLFPSVVIPPLEECPVAQASNDYLSYTYLIPEVGYVYRYSEKRWENELFFAPLDGRGSELVCLGELVRMTPKHILDKMMPTYEKMAEGILNAT